MFKKSLILMLAVEALSLLAFVYPMLGLPLLVIFGLAVLAVSIYSPGIGMYILFGELFFGSRGHLLGYKFISLREVIFAVVIFGWIINQIQKSKFKSQNYNLKLKNIKDIPVIYWLFMVVIIAGGIYGVFVGNGVRNVFADVTAYLYFIILPIAFLVIQSKEQLKNIMLIMGGAAVAIALKTFLVFIWFSFGIGGVATVYHWIVNTGLGEITGDVGSASRVFLASQFYSLIAAIVFGLAFLLRRLDGWFSKKFSLFVFSAGLLGLIMSLSRSFWLGGAAAAFFAACVLLFVFKVKFGALIKRSGVLVLVLILELGVLYGVVTLGSHGFAGAVTSRVGNPAQEAAGSARLFLLPKLVDGINRSPFIGSGFGEQITYQSFLPDRVSAENPYGTITSYRFEWGYLDIILKIGLVGMIVYLLFISRIVSIGWRNFQFSNFNFQTLGMLSGLVALLILNITTPYLNHPLGIGFLIFSFLSVKINEPAAG